MNTDQIIDELLGIRQQIAGLQAREVELRGLLATKKNATELPPKARSNARPILTRKRKKAGFSYYQRKKLSKRMKARWLAMTPEQRAAYHQKLRAGKQAKKGHANGVAN